MRYLLIWSLQNVYACVFASDSLLKGAEELGIRKPLRHRYGGGITEFVYAERHRFSGIEQPKYFLTSQERQTIVRHTLFKLRSDGTDTIENFTFDFGQPIIPYLLANAIIKQILPLHDIQEIYYLRSNWIHSNFPKQPLDAICSYFGVKIAMYFAYMSHYTYALSVPGTMGFLCWALSDICQLVDDVCFIAFSLLNFVWPVLYLEHWKRRSATYAYRWGTIDVKDEQLMQPRPLFHGELHLNPITREMEFFYPTWKRIMFRCLVTFPMMTLSLCIVILVTWLNLEFQASFEFEMPQRPFTLNVNNVWPIINSYLPKILLALSVVVCGEIYKRLAYWLNNKGRLCLTASVSV
ncbi:hypothetical protein NP493_10g06016 [Ridgeia piscesae]|uniref:Anoctamin n=1 Tax=Ridgeia piscesae TaxID=27915 RepID=A0AAD9PEX6_RIDPI|nr:hypothetical protein NP493_10g06016 [Ridgeia piscesae]